MPIRKGDGTGLNPKNFAEVRLGDGSILHSGVTMYESFEDGDMAEYTGDTASFVPDNSPSITVPDGNYLCSVEGTGYESVYSTSGLANYPVQDQPFGATVYSSVPDGGSTTQFAVKYGVQDSNNWYEMRYELDSDHLLLTRESGGSATVLADDLGVTGGAYDATPWFFRIDWTSSGDHTLELYDDEGGTLMGSIGPVNDTTHGNGGLGFRSYLSSTSDDLYVDAVRSTS